MEMAGQVLGGNLHEQLRVQSRYCRAEFQSTWAWIHPGFVMST